VQKRDVEEGKREKKAGDHDLRERLPLGFGNTDTVTCPRQFNVAGKQAPASVSAHDK
jgi:hypothetical protein